MPLERGAGFNVVRNFGGSVGITVATTLLTGLSQYHDQSTLTSHVNVCGAETADHLRHWTEYSRTQGADQFTRINRLTTAWI